jgi:hypothetical protein
MVSVDPDRSRGGVDVAAAQREQLTSAQARPGGHENRRPVASGHRVGDGRDLLRRGGMSLVGTAVPAFGDVAGIGDDDAVADGGVEHGAQQPVGLGGHGAARLSSWRADGVRSGPSRVLPGSSHSGGQAPGGSGRQADPMRPLPGGRGLVRGRGCLLHRCGVGVGDQPGVPAADELGCDGTHG